MPGAFVAIVASGLLAVPAGAQRHPALPDGTKPLVPNAVAFRDGRHGLLGMGWARCDESRRACRAAGTISVTVDAGRSWKIVLRVPRSVTWVGFDHGSAWARFGNGETLRSLDGGRTWTRAALPHKPRSPCPPALAVNASEVVVTPGGKAWALCAGQGGAGQMSKAVYRRTPYGWKRVASATFYPQPRRFGGLGGYGYPAGIAMADNGFGIIWETRGTLLLTRNGGSRWHYLPSRFGEPEVDWGVFATVVQHGVGFAMLMRGDASRLIETRDAGRTWHVRHRWHYR